MMLYKLLSRMDYENFETEVISLIDIGPIGRKIQTLGVPVRAWGMRRGVPDPVAVLRLARWLRRDLPDIIQTWGYHENLIGGLAAWLARSIPVAWGIHHTDLDPQVDKRSTIWTAMVCARLSRWLPAQIVCCSQASLRVHSHMGYASGKMLVIPNGFDLAAFKPDPGARKSVLQELGVSEDVPLVGLVARFDPNKDHRNFIQAAAILNARLPEIHFLLCGDGITWKNPELAGWIEAAGIRDSCHLLGCREDIPRLTAALDIASSASTGEAFPLMIGEAMACGVPCVVTDVGDSAIIVGETGVVVPPREPRALAAGWSKLLLAMSRGERRQLGLAARQRIIEKYNLEKIVDQYQRLYESLVTAS